MAKRIAQFIFNRFFADFIEEYNRCFGEHTEHFREHALRDFRKLHAIFECQFEGTYLQIGQYIFFPNLPYGIHDLHISPNNECYIDGRDYVDPNAGRLKLTFDQVEFIKQCIPSNPQDLDHIDRYMNLMLESFRDPKMVDLLQAKSDSLILDRAMYAKCPIFRAFQMDLIWGKSPSKKYPTGLEAVVGVEEKEIIFKYWLGCYCIAKSVLLIPGNVLTAIEKEAIENSKSMQTSKSINFSSMKRTGKEMLKDLTNDRIFKLYDYLTETCLSPYTPLYNLIPEKYHPTVTNLREMWKDPKIRLVIADHIKPLLEDIKKSHQVKGIQIIDEDDDFDEEDPNVDPEKRENHEKARSYAIETFLDLCIGVVEKNQEIINNTARNPASLKNVILQGPNIATLFTRVQKEFRTVLQEQNQKNKSENKETGDRMIKIGDGKDERSSPVNNNHSQKSATGSLQNKLQNNYMTGMSTKPNTSTKSYNTYSNDDNDFVSVEENS